jgi:hypothetical protein
MNIKLITDHNIEQCKKILVNDAKKMFLLSEGFIVRFPASTSIKISRAINTSRYFRGIFLEENTKTILEGCFIKRKGWFVLNCFFIFFHSIFFLICLSSFFNSDQRADKIMNFIGCTIAVFCIFFTIFIIKITRRKDEKDERVIVEKIKRLLDAKEIVNDEIGDDTEN